MQPWIFTEIKERRDWDISSRERLDMIGKLVDYGLEHWVRSLPWNLPKSLTDYTITNRARIRWE